jgi:predicted RNA binding protein YcfA (HicA-like mRNA interferase family)
MTLKKFFKELQREGWSIERNRHYKLRSPDGHLISTSCTPKDEHNAVREIKRDIKRKMALCKK